MFISPFSSRRLAWAIRLWVRYSVKIHSRVFLKQLAQIERRYTKFLWHNTQRNIFPGTPLHQLDGFAHNLVGFHNFFRLLCSLPGPLPQSPGNWPGAPCTVRESGPRNALQCRSANGSPGIIHAKLPGSSVKSHFSGRWYSLRGQRNPAAVGCKFWPSTSGVLRRRTVKTARTLYCVSAKRRHLYIIDNILLLCGNNFTL